MKYMAIGFLFLFGSEILSLLALLAMAAMFIGDILKARMGVGK